METFLSDGITALSLQILDAQFALGVSVTPFSGDGYFALLQGLWILIGDRSLRVTRGRPAYIRLRGLSSSHKRPASNPAGR